MLDSFMRSCATVVLEDKIGLGINRLRGKLSLRGKQQSGENLHTKPVDINDLLNLGYCLDI